MKNKKDLLAIVGLLILATIFSFSYLNFKPKTALSQTSSSDKYVYTTFKTDNVGFRFLSKPIIGAYYKGETTNKNYGSASIYDIGKEFYLYECQGQTEDECFRKAINATNNPYPRLPCDKDSSNPDLACYTFTDPVSHQVGVLEDSSTINLFRLQDEKVLGDLFYVRSGGPGDSGARQIVFNLQDKVIVTPKYADTYTYAPLFAQMPSTTSADYQVATKGYVDKDSEIWANQYTYWKKQMTEVFADDRVLISLGGFRSSINTPLGKRKVAEFWLNFTGAGPDGTVAKNCPLPRYFDCVSYVKLLSIPEYYHLVYGDPYNVNYKSLEYYVTLRGRSGQFRIHFCQNFKPEEKDINL
jgi:hypothetical protein